MPSAAPPNLTHDEIASLAIEDQARLMVERAGPEERRALALEGAERLCAAEIDPLASREERLRDDEAHLQALKDAYQAVAPIWDAHPDWTFDQCCAALRKQKGATS